MPATATKPKPGVVTVDVTAPAPRNGANALYAYVPGDGLFCGDGKSWHKASAGNTTCNALRRQHHLADWLTRNPLAVAYATVTDTSVTLVDIYMSGDWVPTDLARRLITKLPWVEVKAKK